jgi:hypothetical protein
MEMVQEQDTQRTLLIPWDNLPRKLVLFAGSHDHDRHGLIIVGNHRDITLPGIAQDDVYVPLV